MLHFSPCSIALLGGVCDLSCYPSEKNCVVFTRRPSADCQMFGQKSHLASILSEEEHRRIASAITGAYEIKGPVWIGLFRKKKARKVSKGGKLSFSFASQ
uniref:Uncharacterized protein n=1 Tax=Podarcis muralis TaxID=64176 RepID=A0A670JBM4_PODMU